MFWTVDYSKLADQVLNASGTMINNIFEEVISKKLSERSGMYADSYFINTLKRILDKDKNIKKIAEKVLEHVERNEFLCNQHFMDGSIKRKVVDRVTDNLVNKLSVDVYDLNRAQILSEVIQDNRVVDLLHEKLKETAKEQVLSFVKGQTPLVEGNNNNDIY